MENEQKDFYKSVITLLGALIVLPLSIIFGGYITMFLWNGIMPATFGVTSLTLAQGVGIDVFVSFVTYQRVPSDDKGLANQVLSVLFMNLMFMLIGWVVMFFI